MRVCLHLNIYCLNSQLRSLRVGVLAAMQKILYTLQSDPILKFISVQNSILVIKQTNIKQ